MRERAEPVAARTRELIARVTRWYAEQRRAPSDSLLKGFGVVAAGAGVVALLVLVRDDARSFDSLAEMYEPLASVGLSCAPPPPVRTDPATGRDRVFCSASDGSLAVLELSDSYADAEQAVIDAHAGSRRVLRYAEAAGQKPFAPNPVLLGDNWTLLANQTVLERVAADYGGIIYPYPELP